MAMTHETTHGLSRSLMPWSREQYLIPQWYALYTSANHEKSVAAQLAVRDVDHFVPLYAAVRQWKDRRTTLHLPLFSGYVFVRIALCDQLRVAQIPGVVRLVGFNGKPAMLPETEIAALHAGMANGIKVEPHAFVTVGRWVRIQNGPFAGVKGILLRRKGRSRVVISIELLRQSIAIEMAETDIALAL